MKRWFGRRLPLFILALFAVLYVHFEWDVGRLSGLLPAAARRRLPSGFRSPRAVPAVTPEARATTAVPGRRRASGLRLKDIFIAVKTTGRFHGTRLALLLQTWISTTKTHTFIFTDTDDDHLKAEGYNMVMTSCSSDHSQQALACKMAAEYNGFLASDKRWFCHVDDDNYVNGEALVAMLAAFPQDGDIYVGKASLYKPITAHELMEGNQTGSEVLVRHGRSWILFESASGPQDVALGPWLSLPGDIGEDPSARRLHGGLHCGGPRGCLHGPLPIVPLALGEPHAASPRQHPAPGDSELRPARGQAEQCGAKRKFLQRRRSIQVQDPALLATPANQLVSLNHHQGKPGSGLQSLPVQSGDRRDLERVKFEQHFYSANGHCSIVSTFVV